MTWLEIPYSSVNLHDNRVVRFGWDREVQGGRLTGMLHALNGSAPHNMGRVPCSSVNLHDNGVVRFSWDREMQGVGFTGVVYALHGY